MYKLYKGFTFIGKSTLGIDPLNKKANIYNISIDLPHTNKKYGSRLLHYIEDDVKDLYNIDKIGLLAYQKPIENLEWFYQTNGYIKSTNNLIQNHDDGEYIYDIISMEKNIKY